MARYVNRIGNQQDNSETYVRDAPLLRIGLHNSRILSYALQQITTKRYIQWLVGPKEFDGKFIAKYHSTQWHLIPCRAAFRDFKNSAALFAWPVTDGLRTQSLTRIYDVEWINSHAVRSIVVEAAEETDFVFSLSLLDNDDRIFARRLSFFPTLQHENHQSVDCCWLPGKNTSHHDSMG